MAPKRAAPGATKKAPAAKADTSSRITKATRTRRTMAGSAAASSAKPSTKSASRDKAATSTRAASKKTSTTAPAKTASKGPKEAASSSSSSKAPARGRVPSKKSVESAKATNQANIKRKRARSPSPDASERQPASKPARLIKKAKLPEQHIPKPARPTKKAKVVAAPKPKIILNTAPTDKLNVYVTGEGSGGELGLGNKSSSIDVKRPRLNALLAPDVEGVVQIACGGMHVLALTHDNRILSWGVNDKGALGRSTEESASDDVEDDEDDDDACLNPKEATPTSIPSTSFPEGTTFVQVAAGDSCSFALTDDGLVYGWGMFRDANGDFGFSLNADRTVNMMQNTPTLIKGLKNIVNIDVGADHAVALDKDGNVFAWGTGANGQLARRTMERRKYDSLNPQHVALPKHKIASVHCGTNHTFAITKTGEAYAWGLNNFGQCGITDKAGADGNSIIKPEKVKLLIEPIKIIAGGNHHSIACTQDGDLLTFGKCRNGLSGTLKLPIDDEEAVKKDERGQAAILLKPLKVNEVPHKTVFVTAGAEHDIALNEEGKAYAWGFNGTYQLGLGEDAGDNMDNVLEATLVQNTAVRDQKLMWAGAGGQFSMFASVA